MWPMMRITRGVLLLQLMHILTGWTVCARTPPNSLVRLVDSGSTCSGRVEVFHNNQWGTVCDDNWDEKDAEVVCRQIGCGRAREAPRKAHFGQGSGNIWLDDVECSGNEQSLTDCPHQRLGTHNCGHKEDAGVICEEPPRDVVRLVDSDSRCSGRVEVFHNNQWGTVCDDNWDKKDAEVVCRQIGCGRALEAPRKAHFGQGSGNIWLDDVECSGNEQSLTDCPHHGLGTHNCGHKEDAGVICEEPPRDVVRLVDSDSRCSGRVEVFHNNQWGTVCDDNWDEKDAEVVCRQIGCGRAREAPRKAHFGPGSGKIWLDDLECSGNEQSLTDCPHQGLGTHNCGHKEDAGVICEETTPAPPSYSVRLVDSDSRCSGRVEVFHNKQWGTVCDDDWDEKDAEVVCRQIGCGRALDAPRNAHFGQGSGNIWLDDLECSGNEQSLTDCPHRGLGTHNCGHKEDAGVTCEETTPAPPSYSVRLVDSGSTCSGRVEVFHNNQWGTVCDDAWDEKDAEVVCRQIGCGKAVSAPRNAHFGQGSGNIWLDDLQCSGNEQSLTDCPHQGLGTHNCGHHEDAGVTCEAPQSVRLVDSGSRCSGRVEVFHNNQWGTVCKDYWDLKDAEVVCRQIGCGKAESAPGSDRFGQGSGEIWLDDVKCSGNEQALLDCPHQGLGTHNCGHHEDAGVVCEGQ